MTIEIKKMVLLEKKEDCLSFYIDAFVVEQYFIEDIYHKFINVISMIFKSTDLEEYILNDYSKIVFDNFNKNEYIKTYSFKTSKDRENKRSIMAAYIILDFLDDDFILGKEIWNLIINYLAYKFDTSYEYILISFCLIYVEDDKNIETPEDLFERINYEELETLGEVIYDFYNTYYKK